jgi:hypothetical protein
MMHKPSLGPSGLSYADIVLGDKSTFITTELHQLPVYGEQ